MQRSDVTFTSRGAECAGWLYRPDGDGPHPIVVMAHGFSATRELRLDAYAERFAAAGLGVLLFDYRHFGASGGEPRQLLDVSRQLADWRAAVDAARAVDWADADRVALFGSSFSGGHVVTIGAEDPRLKALVAQCPFSDGLATLAKLGPVTALRLTGHALADVATALLRRPPHYVPAVAEPGGLAVMNTPDAKAGMTALVPADSRWQNRVAARIGLRVPFYRPGRKAARLQAPALWCITDRDTLCPAGNTAGHASRAPHGVIKHYPVGHFDIYLGEHFERAVTDQTEFLAKHLLPAG